MAHIPNVATKTEVQDAKTELAASQSELAKAQTQFAKSQSELSASQSQLATSQNALASAQTQLAQAQSQLATKTEVDQKVDQLLIQKWTGPGPTATKETGSKVWEHKVSNNAQGLIQIVLPANIGFTNITNIQLTVEGVSTQANPMTAMKAPHANYENVTNTGFTIRVTKPKQVIITALMNLNAGIVFDTAEQCPDTTVKINIRVAGT